MRTIPALLLILLLGLTAAGCPSSETCLQDVAACPDAGDGSCAGQCIVSTQIPAFALLWSGPVGATAPSCPNWAIEAFHGFLDTPPDVTCSPTCACASSSGTCMSSSMFANAGACAATGQQVPFDPPATWDGSCTTMDAVASAASVTVNMPVVLPDGICNAGSSNVKVLAGGPTIALVCNIDVLAGACPTIAEACGPPSVPDFKVCGPQTPGVACPANLPVQHVFYDPSLACACSCGPSMGDSCSETVTAYSDSTCSDKVGSGSLTSNEAMTCFDVTAGPLGSKKATFSYTPGTCQPTLTKLTPQTFCCAH
jgi:hypothetical protein